MTTVVITLPGTIHYLPVLGPAPTRFLIKTEDSLAIFTPPWAPRNVSFSGRLYDYTSVDRPGRRALQLRSAPQSPTMSFDLYLGPKRNGNTYGYSDQTANIQKLQSIMSGTKRVVLTGVKWLSGGYWRATKMDIDTETLNPDQSVRSCTVSCEFVYAEDWVKAKGPTTGGVKPPPAKAKPKTTTPPKKVATPAPSKKKSSKSVRKYKVKRGDTLSKIAIKFYKNASKWRLIADKNKIKDPRKLTVGKTLIIP